MHTRDARAVFDALVSDRGGTRRLDARSLQDLMLTFYASVRADDVAVDDGDMLLFQWGTYDWGDGPRFEYDLTRQFITADEVDDDAIFQLAATLRYAPTHETVALAAGNRWCWSPAELGAYHEFIDHHPATAFARSHPPVELEVRFGNAG
jgi:hypothetical protein